MRFFFSACSSSMALLICTAALTMTAGFGQSLSIRKGESNYWIEATAPANNPHTLQASANLHLWVDIRESVQEPYSFAFDKAGVSQRYMRLIPLPPPTPPIRVLLIGDSLAADCCGWGRGMYGYFKPNATVINYASPRTSSKGFLQSAEMDKMVLIRPNYVLIQFGFVDEGSDPDRSTTLEEFATNLRTLVQTVRGFNGVPILITLHPPRAWDENGKVIPAWEPRNAVTRQVAAELKTPLVDLYQGAMELYNELGPSSADFMHFGGPGDAMHFSQLGGQYVSRVVLNDLPDAFGPYLTGILEPPPEP
jgi:lysophospholipase L1-like esterase